MGLELDGCVCVYVVFFFSSRRRHTRFDCDWSSDVCSSDLGLIRPSLVGDPFAGVARDRFLNPAAFSTSVGITSVTNAAGQTISFGNLGRNPFRGPAIWNTDLSFFKNTMVTESLKFQLGIELFNAWNHTNLTVPNNNTGDPGALGRFDGAYPGRVVQYRAKFIF